MEEENREEDVNKWRHEEAEEKKMKELHRKSSSDVASTVLIWLLEEIWN